MRAQVRVSATTLVTLGLSLLLLAGLGLSLAWAGRSAPEPAWRRAFTEVHPTLSRGGEWLCFEVDEPALAQGRTFGRESAGKRLQLALIDTRTGHAQRLPRALDAGPPDGDCSHPYLSADGSRLAFLSEATNLTPDDRDAATDVFVLERTSGTLQRLAPPLEQIGKSSCFWPSLSPDGATAGYSSFGVPQGERRFVLHDLQRDQSYVGPVDAPAYGRLSFSPDGRRVAGAVTVPRPTLHIDLFEIVRASEWGPPIRITQGADGPSHGPVLSERACTFATLATNLAPNTPAGHYSLVTLDLQTAAFALLTPNANDDCLEPSVCEDGRRVAFTSYADNLVGEDRNQTSDVFVLDCSTGQLRLLSRSRAGGTANGASYNPCLSGDGRWVAFVSRATDLVDPVRPAGQVFLYDLETDRVRCVAP